MTATATASCDDELVARNPATGTELGRVPATPPERLPELVARARRAQEAWAASGWRVRQAVLEGWRRVLSREAGEWADRIQAEIGKPRIEAMGGDVLSTLDAIRWTVRHGGRALREQSIGAGGQRWLLMSPASIRWVPYGVVGMLGTWNYPLFLNAPPIAQALAAGNAVVWKASELAVWCAALLDQGLKDAGLPEGLLTVVYGAADVGRALVESDLDKAMFTGGIENGRAVLGALARRGVPALAELSGFDPAIVLPDAPLASTVKALNWAAFVGCGQTCVAVKRVYVVGDAALWADSLAAAARALRVGDPASTPVDMGPMITDRARERFHGMIEASVDAGGVILTGGAPMPGPGWFYPPTVIKSDSAEAEDALAGSFGPVVIVRGFTDAREALHAANRGPYALAASVWGRDMARARAIAGMIHAGMVSINDAVTPTAHASAPFGGARASGFGRTKGPLGLREFAQPLVISRRKAGGLRPHLFPYPKSPWLDRFFTCYRRSFHRGW
jgi:acyl-CoA reductase-like NAD-dependent aldehyde dehydrogenase